MYFDTVKTQVTVGAENRQVPSWENYTYGIVNDLIRFMLTI